MKLDNSWASLDGIDRVGFPVPDPIHIYAVCVMFKCYHAIRLGHPELVNRAFKARQFDAIHSLLLDYTRHFADEISLRHLDSD